MNFNDVRLIALTRTGRTVIGQVRGKEDAEFEMDWPTTGYMQIEIDMLAGPRCVTEELQVDRGDLLDLQIAAVFTQTVGCR